MKKRNKIMGWVGGVCLAALSLWAANPSFSSFLTTQFATTTDSKIAIKDSASVTNLVVTSSGIGAALTVSGSGILSLSPFVGQAGSRIILYSNLTTPVIFDSTNGLVAPFLGIPSRLTNGNLTASTLVSADSAKVLTSIANGSGALTNDGAGVFGYMAFPAGGSTGSNVTSVAIPMGAWFINNVATNQYSAASSVAVTNSSDGFSFLDAVTNVMRTRFALPWDWDNQPVKVEVQALCLGVNGVTVTSTNAVFGVRAAALADGDRADLVTFGTLVTVTNHISTNAYILRSAITGPVTVGNTPTVAKSILWEVQRLGADAGDNLTNVLGATVTEVRVYYSRTNRTDYPASSN